MHPITVSGLTQLVLDIRHRVAVCCLFVVLSKLFEMAASKVKWFTRQRTESNDGEKATCKVQTGSKRSQHRSEPACHKPKRTRTTTGAKDTMPKETTHITSKVSQSANEGRQSIKKVRDANTISKNVTAETKIIKTVEPLAVSGKMKKSTKRKHDSSSKREAAVGNAKVLKDDERSPRKVPSVCLDRHNCDLNICIDEGGRSARSLNDCTGLQLLWGGVRATRGVYQGSIFFEVKITEQFEVAELARGGAILRVGWSSDGSSLLLGEDSWSFCYCSSGDFICERYSTAYGDSFQVNDVIGVMLENNTTRPAKISFTKNGRYLGEATTLPVFPKLDEHLALFPHIAVKNCKVKVNFGDQKQPWFPKPKGFTFIGHCPLSETVPGMSRPGSESKCEFVRAIGPPGEEKSQWMRKYVTLYPEKKYVILSSSELCQRMDVVGLPKKFAKRRMDCLGHVANECLFRLMSLVSGNRRNCIVDDVNLTETDIQEMLWIFKCYEQRDISEGRNNTAEQGKSDRFSETTTESWGDEYENEEW